MLHAPTIHFVLQFTECNGRLSILERSLSTIKLSFYHNLHLRINARVKAGINFPLTRFQTVDYCNLTEQMIVLLIPIQRPFNSGLWLLNSVTPVTQLLNMHSYTLFYVKSPNCSFIKCKKILSSSRITNVLYI